MKLIMGVMNNFRNAAPNRTCVKEYANYRSYKPHLATDFLHKCGYTNCSDCWFGGKDNFHIDHLKPWRRYPNQPSLKTDYNNLVYCCSYVNILKSDDLGTYLDPCNDDFNSHFHRDILGSIIPISVEAKYMYSKMKLYMDRYRIIWMLDQIEDKMSKLRNVITKTNNGRAKSLYIELSFLYEDYRTYLRAAQ